MIDKFLNESNPSYCGLYIKDNSKLLELVQDLDDSWKRIAHHVTIKLGRLPDDLQYEKGNNLPIIVTHIGQLENKVIAVKVKVDVKTYNEFAHVTLAVNYENGGKPFLSNKITEWKLINKKIELIGEIAEFTNNGKII